MKESNYNFLYQLNPEENNVLIYNSRTNALAVMDADHNHMFNEFTKNKIEITDEEFLNGVRDGSVIAGVSGVWNCVAIKEIWGEDTGVAKLPTYSCNGDQIQMASFSGCKLIGVNAYSEHLEWASKLAEWITNEENQRLRFKMRGQGPSNIIVADSTEISQSPEIAALLEQSEFSQLQRVGGKFWDPVSKFAGSMAAGNPSGQDLQEQLDEMVEGVCAR